jgi:cell division protein FtsB
MMKKERKIFSRLIFNPKILAVSGLIIIVLLSFPIAKNASKRYAVNNEIKELEKEIKSMEDRSAKLNQLIDYLSSNQYLEEQARLNFGLKKKGEEMVVIDSGKNRATATDASSFKNAPSGEIFNIPGIGKEPPAKPLSNPQKWWRYFFKN